MKPITEHEGQKYLRMVRSAIDPNQTVMADVYEIFVAWNVTCPARQHAIKKLLLAGDRGKGSALDDLNGADAAVSRAIQLQRNRENPPPHMPDDG